MIPICVALWGCPSIAAAQDQGITPYPASFFADAHPATAKDMLARLPGFTLDTGNSSRGFAGSGGNVLIDGARPTAKTDDLSTILNRVSASSVERIDLIRGGAPGLDMQGQTVIADIVLKKDASDQAVVTLTNVYTENGGWVPAARVEYHGHSGAVSYEASLARTADQNDDSPGNGYRRTTPAGGVPQIDSAKSYGIYQLGWSAHGAITAPLWGGSWDNNLTLQTTDFSQGVAYSGSGGSRFDFTTRQRNGEFGSHWTGTIGSVNLETLVLQRLGDELDLNSSAVPGDSALFSVKSSSGESIARLTARYSFSPNLNVEAGGEGAYNFLDGRSSYIDNGAAIAVPDANAAVTEKRAEGFASLTWKITPALTLEAGMRAEYSIIAETGDTSKSRNFFYPKPRATLAWALDSNTQLRARVERKLGQLNFADFVASSDLSTFGVAAGNADLRPDQRWQIEGTAERHFLAKGALVVSLLHEEITDLRDFIPVGGGLDAPGNIPHATNDTLTVTGTLPLDWTGIHDSLIKTTVLFDHSELTDPVTGATRRFSNQRNQRISLEFDQDLTGWKSSWGFGYLPLSYSFASYRIDNVTTIGIHVPYSYAFWTYNPAPDWSLRFQADNITPYRFEQRQEIYAGPRGTSPLTSVQDTFLRTRPRFLIQLRKTF